MAEAAHTAVPDILADIKQQEWHRHFFPSFTSDPIYADHFDEKINTIEPSEGVSREVYSYNIQKRGTKADYLHNNIPTLSQEQTHSVL